MIITAGKANVTVDVYFVDDDGGTAPGEPTPGLLFSNIETGGSASYHRQGAARVDFTLVTQTVAGAHTDGGFVLIDDTNMPGLYRLDVPDAAFVTGADYVVIQLVAAAANNSIMRPLLIDLTDVDLRDSVRGGMTALPNAAADAAGGLPISDLGGLDLDARLDAAISSRLAAADINLASGVVEANLLQMGGVVQSATDLKDFADAGYDPATNKVQGVVLVDTATAVTNQVTADMTAISGDGPAADNLEAMYDGAGYVAETAPASRAQVGAIGASSGGALSFEANADNSGGTIDPGSTAFVGVETNNFTDTDLEDGVYHIIADSVNVIDVVYGFSVGGGRTGSELIFKGFANVNNDDLALSVWDHVGAGWDVLGTLGGQNGSSNLTITNALLSRHTGTGTEIGKVYVRFNGSSLSASADLNTDQLLVEAVGIGQSVGYANGRIWVNTVNGIAGTEPFVNGVADSPVNLIASAKTLATSVGVSDFHIINGSSITLAESTLNESYFGDNWSLALGGQDVDGAYFQGAHVSGVGLSTTEVHFEGCDIGTMSVQIGHFDFCAFGGTVTQTLAGDYEYHNCYSNVAGAGAPTFTKTAGQAITAEWRNWMDSITVSGLQSGDTITINGRLGTVTLNGADATVEIRGSYKSIVNNLTGSPTVNIGGAWKGSDIADTLLDTGTTLDGKINTINTATGGLGGAAMRGTDGANTVTPLSAAQVNAQVDIALSDYDGPTRTEATSDKAEIITDLDDIKGTGFVKDTHSLFDIEGYVDLIDDGTSGLAKIAIDAAATLVDTGTTLPATLGTPADTDLATDIANAAAASSGLTQMTESYAANGVAPTRDQAMFAIHQMLQQFGISGTSYTVRKLDNSTTAFVVTLDDATNPTDAKRV